MSSAPGILPGPRNPVGAHVPVAGGLARKGLGYARRIGAEAVQVFVANPRGWATPNGNRAEDREFRVACHEECVRAFVHSPYLINFGSANEDTYERSRVSLRHSLLRGQAIGAEGVVVHTGSATGGRSRKDALAQLREGVLPLVEKLDAIDHPDAPAPNLLLEPMAGQGATLCSRMEDLGPYLDALEWHPRIGVCLDTCHAFAAGHDLTDEPEEPARTLRELTDVAGAGRLRLVHANDSKAETGSHLDRHQNIGAGYIGERPFGALLAHPSTQGVPLVVETPGGEERHAEDVRTLRALR